MSSLDEAIGVDAGVKAQHRAIWALGDYATVAHEVIPDLGAALVDACGVAAGARVLDVAAGCGNAAIPAALRGASVVACDLTPELLAAGGEQASRRGAVVEWRRADAEALPFDDDEFDVVLSCVGVMFAPSHRRCAAELVRACRPGGTVGLISWTPDGFVGQMLAAVKPYLAPSPPGSQPPARWGTEGYVAALFGDMLEPISTRRGVVTVDRFSAPEQFRDFFKTYYGPLVAAYRGLADDPQRTASLDADLCELARRHDRGGSSTVMDWEYLLMVARKPA